MTQRQPGANPRQLARVLDTQTGPMAVLDPASRLVFANAQLCEVAGVDAKELIGKVCSWTPASTTGNLQQVLSLLTPPVSALQGNVAVRRLTSPPFFGSDISAELFIPLPGDLGQSGAIIVVLTHWETIKDSLVHVHETLQPSGLPFRDEDSALVELRSRWQHGQAPSAIIGSSDAVVLAARRARIACESSCSVALIGPSGVGREQLARSIFLGRLESSDLSRETGTFQVVDCKTNHGEQFAAQLDLFKGRLRTKLPPSVQTLCLMDFEHIDSSSEVLLRTWLAQVHSRVSVIVICTDVRRQPAELRELEIELPALSTRRVDIAPLVAYEFSRHNSLLGGRIRLDEIAMQLLEAYSWPGNVAELSRAVEAIAESIAMDREAVRDDLPESSPVVAVSIEHLPLEIRTYTGSRQSGQAAVTPVELDKVLEEVEREVISRALKLSPRNRAAAARLLNISRPRLLRRIQQLGLDAGESFSQD